MPIKQLLLLYYKICPCLFLYNSSLTCFPDGSFSSSSSSSSNPCAPSSGSCVPSSVSCVPSSDSCEPSSDPCVPSPEFSVSFWGFSKSMNHGIRFIRMSPLYTCGKPCSEFGPKYSQAFHSNFTTLLTEAPSSSQRRTGKQETPGNIVYNGITNDKTTQARSSYWGRSRLMTMSLLFPCAL